jgi:hypothetical protein
MSGVKPDETKTDDIIQASVDLKNMQQTAGWKRLERFMETQRAGTTQYMQKEANLINVLSLVWLFNTFIKFLAVLWENRAYNRIDTYIKVTIARGEQYAAKKMKEQERQKAKEDKENGR